MPRRNGRVPQRIRDKNALQSVGAARPAFYLCDEGTEGSIRNETGEDSESIGEFWELVVEYCTAHHQPLPPFDVYYMALKQNHKYCKKRDAKDLSCHFAHPASVLCNRTFFENQVRPCMKLLAEVSHAYWDVVINWDDRCNGYFGLWNHVAHFDTVHTNIEDGFPYVVWKPTKWESEAVGGGLGARLLQSGKYKTCCFKGHLWMAFHGLPLGLELCLGVDHDAGIHGATGHRYKMKPREWGMGDLAYGGCERVLVGRKESEGNPITKLDVYWNALIGFYRARVEQVIARLKRHQWCQQVFRGSFEMLMVHFKLTALLTSLSIRREILRGQPLFEVIGPWSHNI